MRVCTEKECEVLKMMLEKHTEELSILKRALSEPQIIETINQSQAIVYDRIINELFGEYLEDDTIVGTAFILGMMQGKISERKKNSDQRTTANRSI